MRELISAPNGLSIPELAERSGMSRPSATSFVAALLEEGIAVRDPATRKLRVGLRLHELTQRAVYRHLPIRLAERELMDLIGPDRPYVIFAVLEGISIVRVLNFEWFQGPANQLVKRGPWWRNRIAHLIAAYANEEQLSHLIDGAVSADNDVDRESLQRSLERLRDVGVLATKHRTREGYLTTAAPVRDRNNNVVAAVGAFVAEVPDHETLPNPHIPLVVAAANRISQSLGYEPEADLELFD